MTNISKKNVNIIASNLLARKLMKKDEILSHLKTDSTGKSLPFKTANEWKANGYYIKKGEKALFKTNLWKALSRKNDEGKWEKVLNEDGSQKFIFPICSIFSEKQVVKMGEANGKYAPENEETRKTEKKETKAKKESTLPPHRDGVVVVKYEKKTKKATSKKATRKAKSTTKVVETKKSEPVKVAPKKATTKKATKKLAKAPTMIRKDFIKDGLKMVEFVASDNSRGFTMPLANYENMNNKKRWDKMWGIA